MSIIVEDGSNVADANSYVDVAYATTYASGRGLLLPTDEATLAPLLVRAFDYVEAQRARYKGIKTYPYGGSQWPRTGVVIDGEEIGEKQIPREIRQAQVRVAVELHSGVDAHVSRQGPQKKRDKTGPLDSEYFAGTDTSMPAVDALLAPLYAQGGGLSLRTMRG